MHNDQHSGVAESKTSANALGSQSPSNEAKLSNLLIRQPSKIREKSFQCIITLMENSGFLSTKHNSQFEGIPLGQYVKDFFDMKVDDKEELQLTFKEALNKNKMEEFKKKYSLDQKYWDEERLATLFTYAPPMTGAIIPFILGACSMHMLEASLGMMAYCGILETIAGGLGMVAILFAWYSLYSARNFQGSIQKALNIFNRAVSSQNEEEYKKVEDILKMEFGEGENGRYQLTRGVRWVCIDKTQYAFAHLLRAECAIERKDEIAFREFDLAYKDAESAQEPTLQALSLLGMIKLLAPQSTYLPPVINGQEIPSNERKELFCEKIDTLNQNHGEIIRKYFNQVAQICATVFFIIRKGGRELTKISSFINQIMNYKDIYLFRFMSDEGPICELMLYFLQGLILLLAKDYEVKLHNRFTQINTLENKHSIPAQQQIDPQQSEYLLIRQKFEECCQCINELDPEKVKVLDSATNIIKEIKNFIIQFFTDCMLAEIFNEDLQQVLRDLKLTNNREEPSLLAEEKILEMVHALNPSYKSITSLDAAFKKIMQDLNFAKIRFSEGQSWLHFLPQIRTKTVTTQKIQGVAKKIIQTGVSPYIRNSYGFTAFSCIPKNDPHRINTIYRPEGPYVDFIGVEEQIEKIEIFIQNVLKNSDTDRHFLLLSGPPGVGKTELMQRVVERNGFLVIPYVMNVRDDRYRGQEETRMIEFFNLAKEKKTCICLLMDEIDSIIPEYQGTASVEHYNPDKINTLLQIEINKLRGTKVILIGATNYLSKLKKAIISRAGAPVVFSLPDAMQRKQFLEDQLRIDSIKDGKILDTLVAATSGWSPRDLSLYLSDVKELAHAAQRTDLNSKDFINAFESMRSRIAEELKKECKECPNIQIFPPALKQNSGLVFENLVALTDDVRKALQGVCIFLKNPGKFKGVNIRKNLMLYGPAGTGKTSFARAIAQNSNALFISISGGDYKSSHPSALIPIFEIAKRYDKAVIFIDEIDAITKEVSHLRETLQTEIAGFMGMTGRALVVVGATNYLANIANPIRRRFKEIEIPLPSHKQRVELFFHYLSKTKEKINTQEIKMTLSTDLDDFQMVSHSFANLTEGFSPREIENAINDAIDDVITQSAIDDKEIPLAQERIIYQISCIRKSLRPCSQFVIPNNELSQFTKGGQGIFQPMNSPTTENKHENKHNDRKTHSETDDVSFDETDLLDISSVVSHAPVANTTQATNMQFRS